MTLEELQNKYLEFEYYQDIKNNRYLFSILTRTNGRLDSLSFQNEVDYSCPIEDNIEIVDKLKDEVFVDKLYSFFNSDQP